MTDKSPIADRIAMRISRIMGSWRYIGLLGMGIETVIWRFALLAGAPLDVFNLIISLYTLLVDLIILKAGNALNDSMNKILNRIIQHEKMSLKYHAQHAHEFEWVRAEVDTLKRQNIEILKQKNAIEAQHDEMIKEFIGLRAQIGLLIQMMPAKKGRDERGRFKS